MIAKQGVEIVRIKTMADNSIRAEIDFGERVKLANFDKLLRNTITIIVLPDDLVSEDIKTEVNTFLDKLNKLLNDRT